MQCKCYICNKNLCKKNIIYMPDSENSINFDNFDYFKKIYNYEVNRNCINIKIIDNFIFFYYNLCIDCFNNLIKFKLNICKILKKREIGVKI